MNKDILNAIDKGKVFAIIPARSGSKGVVDKNIRLLHGYPMIAYTIIAAKLAKNIDRIIVSTDSDKYAEIAREYGAETPFLRPAALAGDNSTDIEFMQHAIKWLYAEEKKVPEYFVHLRPTNPMRKVDIIDDAVGCIKKNKEATSLRSAHRWEGNSPYKWFQKNKEGYFRSILGDRTNDEANNPRQDFPEVYMPDGYVDVLKSEFIINNDLMHGERMIGYTSPASIDIDSKSDIVLLEYFMSKEKSEIHAYLEANFPKKDSI